jgi:2-polyprenyl-3-methyl-5-hydroxy-6-metoxy-1,4-benzoquinol methylase
VLVHTPEVVAALPVSNEADNPAQRRTPPAPYLTLREFQQVTAEMQRESSATERIAWDKSDPAAFLCRTAFLDSVDDPPRRALEGREVVISINDYVHRWSSLRGQAREDLLTRISPDAKSILEFGCGEAPLGAALKARQKCRVVGIELDPKAAAIARKRIDDVYCGDAREIVALMREEFDWIIGGDIVEHIDEPWSFLSDLRHVCAPGGHLLLSIPNVGHGSVIADLLQGRFDYVYMGLTCVGHLRFFTRRSIEEMMSIAGWTIVEIAPQTTVATRGRDELVSALSAARMQFSKDDLLSSGYYVIAQNL